MGSGSVRGNLLDQVAIITGASSGLGWAPALAFARAGADVALMARSERDLMELAREVEAAGRQALVLPVDLGMLRRPSVP